MRLASCLRATVWFLVLLAEAHAQQKPTPEKCVCAGSLLDAVSGQPLPRAHVALTSIIPVKGTYIATTDLAGAFRFEPVEPGDYHFRADANEHSPAQFVELKDGRRTAIVHCQAGLSLTGAVARLDPMGMISGRVTDSEGEPIPNAQVGVLFESWRFGLRSHPIAIILTDDRGAYQHLARAGRYYLSAGTRSMGVVPVVFSEGPGKPEMRYGTVLYPNATDLEGATPVDVRPGQQYTIDFRLTLVATYHIRGAVQPWGSWTGPKSLQIRSDADILGENAGLDKDGRFDQGGVTPGKYTLQTFEMSEVGTQRVPVQVTDRDVDGVIFPATLPLDVKGRLRFDDDSPHDFSQMSVRLRRLDTDFPLAPNETRVNADGTFVLRRLAATRWHMELQPLGDYYVVSATLGQQPVEGLRLDLTSGAAADLEILLSSGAGTVTGTAPPTATMAVIASADGVTGDTRARSAETDQNGGFRFTFVPPGRYYVWAATHFDGDHWQNMDFVTKMEERGVAVEVPKKGSVQTEVREVIE
jgi:Carboxypeptidase regulatory-like domain